MVFITSDVLFPIFCSVCAIFAKAIRATEEKNFREIFAV